MFEDATAVAVETREDTHAAHQAKRALEPRTRNYM
jgi:hypothetical protein